ncbi:hypothetical protein QQ045_014067 [Rhodiola kirilowii]
MEAILIDSVHVSLRQFMYRNAIFMCERLCAEFHSEANLQLLATCYLQNNQAYAAYFTLKGMKTARSRYLFALSCFQLDLLTEAEAALCPDGDPKSEVPDGAAGHYLLGLIYRYTDRSKSAVHHFKLALLVDPLLWAAYEELCALGAFEEASTCFSETDASFIHKKLFHRFSSQSMQPSFPDLKFNRTGGCSMEESSPKYYKHVEESFLRSSPRDCLKVCVSQDVTSQPTHSNLSHLSFTSTPSPIIMQSSSSLEPPPLCRNMQPNCPNPNVLSTDAFPVPTARSTSQAPRWKLLDEGKLRKISGRLFSDSGLRRSVRLKSESGSSVSCSPGGYGNQNDTVSKSIRGSKSGSRASRSGTIRRGNNGCGASDEGLKSEACNNRQQNLQTTASTSSSLDESKIMNEGAQVLLDGASKMLGLLRTLGQGLRLSSMYSFQDALDIYLQLPQKHYNTGWVLSQVGKLHFEQVDYNEADRAFSRARLASPHCLDGMDLYSTVLYHLKEDMKLSYLAQELVSTDRLSPQSWFAMGNCYSLQKDHETALKMFRRATQLNPKFAYAHTLCGHEYVAIEEFENGIMSYQTALQYDARHYNAWYGLGMIYLRQEKHEFAVYHLQKALQINPYSSIIMSYLGTALHAQKKTPEALNLMNKAILADKRNPLPMYHKANILKDMGKYDEALQVLEELKEYAPHESSVYALMGSIYKRQNMHDKAMFHFGISLDLRPPATDVASIKAAMERLLVPDDMDESI